MGYTKDHVEIVLKAGSVIAEVSITPLKGTTAASLSSSMNTAKRDTIAASMAAKVKKVPSIETALADGKTLADLKTIHEEPEIAAPPATPEVPTGAAGSDCRATSPMSVRNRLKN